MQLSLESESDYTTAQEVCKLSLPIYLAFSPEEADRAAKSGLPLACMGYRLSSETPTLLAPSPLPDCSAMLLLQDDVLPSYAPSPALARLIGEYAAAYHTGLICDCDRAPEPFWETLLAQLDEVCARLDLPLWTTEAYAEAAPHAWVLIGASQIGGDFARRMAQAAARYPERCVLELQPMALRLTPPCPEGGGEALSPQALEACRADWGTPDFFSEALCCRYCSTCGEGLQMLLYDTRETLRTKLEAAERAGFRAAVGLLQELSVRFPAPAEAP